VLRAACYNIAVMSGYELAIWRLILTGASDGARQMAVDEAIWRAVAAGQSPPTLRLYAWEPPCLSLGRHQAVAEVDGEALWAAGYGLVRRPSGGRAILHTDELTYSVAVGLDDPRVRGGVLESCRRISAGLLEAVRRLGVEAVAHQGSASRSGLGPVCFETPGEFEITVAGRKLIGSAQLRAEGALLQHGALPLRGDLARICPFLRPPADPQTVRARATTLEQAVGRAVSWDEAAAAVAEGFRRALNLRLEIGDLTSQEREQAHGLWEKYSSVEWTTRL